MRMWMIDPKLLCMRHLCGEHGELHKHIHNLVKGHSIAGRLSPVVQIEPKSILARHDELEKELARRRKESGRPYRDPSLLCTQNQLDMMLGQYPDDQVNAKVDTKTSIRDLTERCEDCRKRIEG